MEAQDLKKLALLGIVGGIMLAAGSADSLYADEKAAEGNETEKEMNGCKGEGSCNGKSECGGPGGCPGKDGAEGKDSE